MMMQSSHKRLNISRSQSVITNKKARRDYQIIKEYIAGIALSGAEVKSIRQGRIKLDQAYIRFLDSGPVLVNAYIPPYQYADEKDYDPTRTRKLLLTKKEIIELQTKLRSSRGLTVVPIVCYNKGRYIKLKIALARGRKKFDKKSIEKRKTIERQQKEEIKKALSRG